MPALVMDGKSTISDRRLKAYRLILRIRPTVVSAWLKRLLRLKRVQIVTNLGAFWIDPASLLGQKLLHIGIHEPYTIGALKALLSDGSTFIDVGANEGYFSVIASGLVGKRGTVVAIEPQHRLQDVLQANIDLNGATNITVRQCAVSDHAGSRKLHLAPDTNSGSSGFDRATRYRTRTESVDTITLEGLVQQEGIDRCDLLKIDIEGHEYEAVLGSPELFMNGRIRAIALEVHHAILQRRGLDETEIFTFLSRCGYHIDRRFPQACVWTRHEI